MKKSKTYNRKGKKAVAKARAKYGRKDKKNFTLTSMDTYVYNAVSAGNGLPTPVGKQLNIGNIAISGTKSNFGGVLSFALNNCNLYNQLQNMFDRYKINYIKVKVIPEWSNSDISASGLLPTMKVARDYDDNRTPTVTDVWSRVGKIYSLRKPFSIYIRPTVATGVYRGAVTTAYSVTKAPYLNMAYPDVTHYGLKFAVKDFYTPSTTVNVVLRFEITYNVTFREQINVGVTEANHEGEVHIFNEDGPDKEEQPPCDHTIG